MTKKMVVIFVTRVTTYQGKSICYELTI